MPWLRTPSLTDGCPVRKKMRRLRLRRAATAYAQHGWPVVAGACVLGDRFTCGLGCQTVECHPAVSPWEEHATTDVSAIAETWQIKPLSVLLATGTAFDVLEVPADVASLAAPGTAARGPVACTPSDRWMFLVRAGGRLSSELATGHRAVLHTDRSWIPAPPLRAPSGGRVRWAVTPRAAGWRVPSLDEVQEAIVTRLPLLEPGGRLPRAA
jgi:Bifunctional DNA primase/polymerase, N-terminal